MIFMVADNPIQAWYRMCNDWIDGIGRLSHMDDSSGVMNYSNNNHIVITRWNVKNMKNLWPKVFELIGYSDKGNKLRTLRNTYLDVEAFEELKYTFKNRKRDRFAYGANFNLGVQRKGGCLSSTSISIYQEYSIYNQISCRRQSLLT